MIINIQVQVFPQNKSSLRLVIDYSHSNEKSRIFLLLSPGLGKVEQRLLHWNRDRGGVVYPDEERKQRAAGTSGDGCGCETHWEENCCLSYLWGQESTGRTSHSMSTCSALSHKGETQTQWSAAPLCIKLRFSSALQKAGGNRQPNAPPPPRAAASLLMLL